MVCIGGHSSARETRRRPSGEGRHARWGGRRSAWSAARRAAARGSGVALGFVKPAVPLGDLPVTLLAPGVGGPRSVAVAKLPIAPARTPATAPPEGGADEPEDEEQEEQEEEEPEDPAEAPAPAPTPAVGRHGDCRPWFHGRGLGQALGHARLVDPDSEPDEESDKDQPEHEAE